MAEYLQQKPVKEILESCKGEIPDKFIHKNGYPQCDVDSVPYMDDTTVDLSLLSCSSPQADDQLRKLHSALTHWGCFQAINHGMTSEFLDELRDLSKQFFALPLEKKQKYSRTTAACDGFGNDTVVSENQTLDWTDRLYLKIYPEHQRKLKYWPVEPLSFRDMIHEYAVKLNAIFEVLCKAIARSLNLDDNCFLDEIGAVVDLDARFNHYPPCPVPENVLGVKPHADSSMITFLLQDKEVEGLHVLKDGQWFKVPIVPTDALLINIGDVLEVISNGILKSPVHRVVTNTARERNSIAVFCFPDPARELGPLSELLTDDRPQKYRRFKDYDSFFFKHYQVGHRALDSLRL